MNTKKALFSNKNNNYSTSFSASTMFKFLIFDENSKLTPIETINVIIPLNNKFPKVNEGI